MAERRVRITRGAPASMQMIELGDEEFLLAMNSLVQLIGGSPKDNRLGSYFIPANSVDYTIECLIDAGVKVEVSK